MAKLVVLKSLLDSYYEGMIEKSTTHKYIRRVPKSTGKGYNYFYPKDFAKPMKALMTLFGMKEEKIDNAYKNNNISQAYGVTKEGFAQHVLEYLTNRKTWNTFFANKANRDKYKIPEKAQSGKETVKVSEKVIEGGKTKEKVSVEATEKKEGNFKSTWNRSLMRKIYSMYNSVPEDKAESKPGIESIKIGDSVSYNGQTGKVTKDFENGLVFVEFDNGGMGRFFVKDLQKMDVTNEEVAETAAENAAKQDVNGASGAPKNTSALSQAMMGNQNAKRQTIIRNLEDSLRAIVQDFDFTKEETAGFVPRFIDINYTPGKVDIPDEVRDRIRAYMWDTATAAKNKETKRFYLAVQNGETPELLRNFYVSINDAFHTGGNNNAQKRDLFDEYGKQKVLKYSDISSGLSDEEKQTVQNEVSKISEQNGFSVSGEDLENYVNMWQNAIRQDSLHDQNKVLYKIYSILEDSNWHTENELLLQGKFGDLMKMAKKQQRQERIWKQKNGILERIQNNESVGEEYFNNLINSAENDEEIEAINAAKKQYYDDIEMKEYRSKSDRWEKYEKKYEEARKLFKEYDNIQNVEQAKAALENELKGWDVTDENLYDKVVAADNFDAAKKARIDYLQEKIKGYNNTMAYGNTFPAEVAGNLPKDVTLVKVLSESKGRAPQEYVEKLYQEVTGNLYWGGARRRDALENEKWENVKEIVRLQNFKDNGFDVVDGKVVTNVVDSSGQNVKEGDVIRVSNSYADSDNGLWRVQKLNDGDKGNSFWLQKVKKDGTESSGKYTTNSWPMNHTYSSNPKYSAAYRAHNGKNGENVKIDIYTVDETLKQKNAAKTPKYQFTSNGVRAPSGEYTSVFYSLNDDGSVNVSSRDYGGTLRFLATETDNVQNNSDTQSDYFDKDRITVTATNPYYKQIKRAALKNEISKLNGAIDNAQKDIEKYTGKESNYYYADQYLKQAKEVLAKHPAAIKQYEAELKKLEKELKGTVKKSLPAFIIKGGRFLIRK